MDKKVNADFVLGNIYKDIIRGFSEFKLNNKSVFVKHFSAFDNISFGSIREEKLQQAIKRGVPTERDRLKILADQNLWLPEDETKLSEQRDYLNGLNEQKKSIHLLSQTKQINNQILEIEAEYLGDCLDRDNLIEFTAEKFADKQINNFYIYHSLFADTEKTIPFFTTEEFNNISEEGLSEICGIYNDKMSDMKDDSIKRLALSTSFQHTYGLSNSVYEFFGKAICYLTYYQVTLITYAAYYKSILSQAQGKAPAHVLTDPDKLEDWFTASKNMEAVLNRGENTEKEGSVTSIFGATQEDIKHLGLQDGESSEDKFYKELEEKGTLSIFDAIKLRGG